MGIFRSQINRIFLFLTMCALAMTASQEAFCQAAITRIDPPSLTVGSKAISVNVYGTGFQAAGKDQEIFVDCDPRNLSVEAGTNDTFYVVVLLGQDKLQAPGEIHFSTAKCDSANNPPEGTKTLNVKKPAKFTNLAPFVEGLVGLDVSAASSASPGAEFLGLLVADHALRSNVEISKDPENLGFKRVLWASGQLGLKGMAQPGTVSGAASAGYYASAINATPDKIVQSIDASFHLGVEFWRGYSSIGSLDINPGGTDGTSNTGSPHSGTFTTVSFIFGGGVVTPLSFSQANPQVYEATQLILQQETPIAPAKSFAPSCNANPTQTPTCYVIFVPGDRTHFYRSYDAGFRFKLYGNDNVDHELRFPAILDITIGQNEYVTGGTFRGTVVHVGGMLPIPRVDYFFIFGSLDLGVSTRNGGGPELQLIPAPAIASVTASSPSVYTISTQQPDRDRYQFGFGIDAIHLFTSLADKKSKKSSSN